MAMMVPDAVLKCWKKTDTEQESAKWLTQGPVEKTQCPAYLAMNFQSYFTSKTKIKIEVVTMRTGDCSFPKESLALQQCC